jgi:branched-chain amino acid transport system substrate-binding protein
MELIEMDATYFTKTMYLIKILPQLLIIFAMSHATAFAIDIGVVAPLDTEYGNAMVSGIALYKDQINQNGGIFGEKVVLWIKNDHNQKREAVVAAKELVDNQKILMILGHYFSSTSIAAGAIYKKFEIPAITASATSTLVTHNNDWYFNIVANNRYLANYLLNYLHQHLHLKNILIIYSSDEYGSNIATIIEPGLKALSIQLSEKFEITPYVNKNDAPFEQRIQQIVNEIKKMDHIGGIIISTHAPTAIKIISSLISTDENYPFIGLDSFGTKIFIEGITDVFHQNNIPKACSKRIHFICHYLHGTSSPEFISSYHEKYHTKPDWISAAYYDAMHMACEAIKGSAYSDLNCIRANRRSIRQSLMQYYNYRHSFNGITGRIFFNRYGETCRPLKIAYLDHLIPTVEFNQYHLLDSYEINDDIIEQVLSGKMIAIDQTVMKKKQMVFAAIEMQSIEDINSKDRTSLCTFKLTLRYKNDFDPFAIQFSDTQERRVTQQQILEQTSNSIITRELYVKGRFSMQSDFIDYPLETHKLWIRFQHNSLTEDMLQFVVDNKQLITNTNLEWQQYQVVNQEVYTDDVNNNMKANAIKSTKQLIYSRFNLLLTIKKQNIKAPVYYALILLGIFGVFLYIVLTKTNRHHYTVMGLCSGLLGILVIYHNYIINDLYDKPVTRLEYWIFSIFSVGSIVFWKNVFSVSKNK